MPSDNVLRKSAWMNPVTICIVVCIVLFINFGFQFGESIGTIVQQIFFPYLPDLSRGIGSQGSLVFRGAALIIQLGVIGLAVARGVAREKMARTALSLLGMVLVLVYFFMVAVGYLLPRLH